VDAQKDTIQTLLLLNVLDVIVLVELVLVHQIPNVMVVTLVSIIVLVLVSHSHVTMDSMDIGKPMNVYLVTYNIVPDVLILTLV
jgi:hypothetical protein